MTCTPSRRCRLARSFLGYATREPGKLRIGRVIEPVVPGAEVHPDCRAAWEDASALLADLGHEVEDVPAPFGADMVPLFETLWYGMATLMPVDPAQEGELLPLTRYLRERGRATSAAELIFAQAFLQIMVRGALPSMNAFDAVLTPTLAQPPVPVGYFHDQEPAENFERQKRFTPFTATYNVSGQPAVNLPLYWNTDGLPIGVMLGGRVGGGGHAHLAVRADRGRQAVAGPPSGALVTLHPWLYAYAGAGEGHRRLDRKPSSRSRRRFRQRRR